jgi:hypothetical protein
MTASQVVAGRLAGVLMRARYGVRNTDMAPLRAIRRDRLASLDMVEATYGWNLEMQMRAAGGLRIRKSPSVAGAGQAAARKCRVTGARSRRSPSTEPRPFFESRCPDICRKSHASADGTFLAHPASFNIGPMVARPAKGRYLTTARKSSNGNMAKS